MNLRDNYLPLSGAIREENLEALFNVKEVSTKYRQIVQSEEFSQELCEQHNALVKLVDELSQEMGRDSRYDQIASKEDLMELVRTNVILNAIGDYGIRDFLVGCGFGEKSMNQDEMDEAIESFLSNTIEHIDDDVELYLREVEVLEAYM